MSPPDCYLRLFDVQKYREIQPVIEGIIKRDVKVDRVNVLVRDALSIVETDDFKKYNDEFDYLLHQERFSDILEKTKENDLLAWFQELDRYTASGNGVLRIITEIVCCPKYQGSTYDRQGEEISGTTIDYTTYYWGYKYALRVNDLLNFCTPHIEKFPFELDKNIGFYNRQYLKEISQSVIEDIETIPQLDCDRQVLEFYDDFNFLLELTNLSDNYTILNEVLD